ncbi:MAG TPA: hypothetical protein VF331_20740 [Polyangiales bacterium]
MLRMKDVTWVAGVCVIWGCQGHPAIPGLKTNSDAGSLEDGGGCGASSCESITWPRLVVALFDERPNSRSRFQLPADVSVVAISGATVIQPMADGGGCPNGFNVINCSYLFYGYPGLEQLELHVGVGSQIGVVKSVALKAFNYCGDDLSYVKLTVAVDSTVTLSEPQYVSPCRILP